MTNNRSQHLYSAAIILIYAVSGMTALAYEVLWARMLALQFGVSIFGVVITVSAFMAGLGLGSMAGRRWSLFAGRPLLWFALFEFVIALLAFATPWLLLQMEGALSNYAASLSLLWWYAVQFLAVSVLLFIPAFCMGAGFPMVLKALAGEPHSLSKVYGVNTVGAAAGALLPLLILVKLGWLYSMQAIALIGLSVSAAALLLNYWMGSLGTNATDHGRHKASIKTTHLLAYAGIGACALMLEVAWTRLFGMLMLRTEYVLAIILAIYLFGVGAGSLLARFMRGAYWLTILPVTAAAFVTAGLWVTPQINQWIAYDNAQSLFGVLFQQGAVLLLFTFPVTLLLGAWLPLLSGKLGNGNHSGALLYGANSVGAALGALAGGFVFTPAIGSYGTIVLAALVMFSLGLTWAHTRQAWYALPLLIAAAVPVLTMPQVARLLPKQYAGSEDLYYYEDAVNITHVVEKADGQRVLLADLQRMDASSSPTAVQVQKNQARLPLLLHPKPESVLFLGLGTGISAAGSLPFPGLERTAVELSQGAINAAGEWFEPVNDGALQQVHVVRDDARHYLMATDRTYDVIIGDLFHPDLVGRSALLSVQQFERAKQRLNPDGVFVQWLALNQFDIQSFEIILRSFRQVFPNAVLFVDAFRAALVGPASTLQGAPAMLANLRRMDDEHKHQATGTEGPWTWLGRFWGPLRMPEGKVQDEWAPQIEFRLPQARYSGQLDLAKVLDYLLKRRPSVGQAARMLHIETQDAKPAQQQYGQFEAAYAATGLAHRSWLAYLTQQGGKAEKILQAAYRANPRDRWIGFAVADGALANLDEAAKRRYDEQQVLESILKIRPDHTEVLTRLWQLESSRGNDKKARQYRARLAELNPLAKELRGP